MQKACKKSYLKQFLIKFSFQLFKERIDEVCPISGLARLLLNQLANYPWVPIIYKQYLFAVAFSYREAELPHNNQVVLPCGRQLDIFRV